MKYFQEVTEWSGNVQNHIYYLSDDKRKMVGYIQNGKKDLIKFSKPMSFDSKGRKLLLLSIKAESDEVYFPTSNASQRVEVAGSSGKKYYLTKTDNKWTCSCPGFTFRHMCKHISAQK
jgi:hypothetical protein